jgi:hypothetical protein
MYGSLRGEKLGRGGAAQRQSAASREDLARTKPTSMKSRNRVDFAIPDTIVLDFRTVLANVNDVFHFR